jgi:hypothetical protein
MKLKFHGVFTPIDLDMGGIGHLCLQNKKMIMVYLFEIYSLDKIYE